MPQRAEGYRGSALRSCVLGLVMIQILAGCGALKRASPEQLAAAGPPGNGHILVHVQNIEGGKELVPGGGVAELLVGRTDIRFLRPMAMGVFLNDLYVVDVGRAAILRYDMTRRAAVSLVNLRQYFTGEPAGMYVLRDGSFYVTDPFGSQVLYFTPDGALLRTFSDPLNLRRPVDVAVDESTGNVYVADSTFSRIIVFNGLAAPLYVIGGRGEGPGQFTKIESIALHGEDALYVVDQVGLPGQLIGLDGDPHYAFGDKVLGDPSAIVEDRYGRVYVADIEDDTIKVFRDGEMVAKLGGRGMAPGEFREIRDLVISEDYLYVTDSMNGRIQQFRIVPPAAGGEQ